MTRVIILLLWCGGLVLSLQGWRERGPTIDMVPHDRDAAALVHDGTIPRRGTVSGYLSFNPPGVTWLVAPGLILFDDPRLFEVVASSLAFLATLAGIYRLARLTFDPRTALLATALFALSDIGTFVAGSLWPRAPVQPFFVWTVVWLHRWAIEREPKALGVALAIFSVGMYVFMEIAPVLLLVPAVWLVYRPPVRVVPLVLAAMVSAFVWWPYLAYEAQNDFRDVRSLISRSVVDADPVSRAGNRCDPNLALVEKSAGTGDDGAASRPVGSIERSRALDTVYAAADRFRATVANARDGVVGGGIGPPARGATLLLLAILAALTAIALGSTPAAWSYRPARSARLSMLMTAAAIVLIVAGMSALAIVRFVSADGVLEERTADTLRATQAGLIVIGLLVLLRASIARLMSAVARLMYTEDPAIRSRRRFLVIALVVPWTITLLLTEPARSERLWWLWPLQVVFLAALVFQVVLRLPRGRVLSACAASVLVGAICVTPSTLAHLRSWAADGWSGTERDGVLAVEYIAQRTPGDSVKVGYHIPFFAGILKLSQADDTYKVGAELDTVLEFKFGIRNASRCVEGIDPDDEYRLVGYPSRTLPGSVAQFDALPGPTFQQIQQFGRIQLFQRVHRE